MDSSSKVSVFLLILILSFSSSFHVAFGCGVCPTPTTPKPAPKEGPIILPPITVKPPVILPPVIVKPPVTLPPVIVKPPVTLPPVIVKPPVILPPVIVKPPVTLPPITVNPPTTKPPTTPGCSPPPAPKKTCPLDILKFGACLDLLGNVIQIGDPAVSECCPLIKGLTSIEAAACLCTTIKLKLLNIYVLYPIAVDLLISCGKTPPPGYTCY